MQRRRGKRNHRALPPLRVGQILRWADAWHARTGEWPHQRSGPVAEGTAETWTAVHVALSKGRRGLPGGSSLAQLLAERRGVRNHLALPPLRVGQILRWADAWHARTGRWPHVGSGPVADGVAETWTAVDIALRQGGRGLPGGDSLARLLARRRGVRNHLALPPLRVGQILRWADAWHARTGRWPHVGSGPVADGVAETWAAIGTALRSGVRGLPGGDSLAQLLARRRGVRNPQRLPPFSEEQILAWADEHYHRTGEWPRAKSGRIAGTEETWKAVQMALYEGLRGLPGGSSLAQLLKQHRPYTTNRGRRR